MDYPTYCGLILNLNRAIMIWAIAGAKGHGAVLDPANLEREWADAMAIIDESAVNEIDFRLNTARAQARMRARDRRRMGG